MGAGRLYNKLNRKPGATRPIKHSNKEKNTVNKTQTTKDTTKDTGNTK